MEKNYNEHLLRTVHYELLRPQEILDEKDRKSIIYLPLGPLEWHGPAMPLGTDPLAAGAIAKEAAKVTGGVVLPTLYWGTEIGRPEKQMEDVGFENPGYIVVMDYPNNSVCSFYAKYDIFSLMVREYLNMIVKMKYKLIVLVNGHGADIQVDALDKLAREFSYMNGSRVINIFACTPLNEKDTDFGHATRAETSIQMYLNPNSVDLLQLPPDEIPLKSKDYGIVDGATFAGNPNKDKTVIFDLRQATVELGKQYIEKGVASVIEQVNMIYQSL